MKRILISIILGMVAISVSCCFKARWDRDYYSYDVGFRMDGKEYHKAKGIPSGDVVGAYTNDTILICSAGITLLQDAPSYDDYSDRHTLVIESIFDSLTFQNGYHYEITTTDNPLPDHALAYDEIKSLFVSLSGRQSVLHPFVRIIFNNGSSFSAGWNVTAGWVSYEFDEPLRAIGNLYMNPDIPEYMIKKIEFEFEAEDENGITHHITEGYVCKHFY